MSLPMHLLLFLLLGLPVDTILAEEVYRCEVDGVITFTDQPCGERIELKVLPPSVPPNVARAELEYLRAFADSLGVRRRAVEQRRQAEALQRRIGRYHAEIDRLNRQRERELAQTSDYYRGRRGDPGARMSAINLYYDAKIREVERRISRMGGSRR